MLTPKELGEALTAVCQPLHVLDPQDMRILYQNQGSIDLFGRLADFATLLALRDPGEAGGRPPLRSLYRLRTRRGPRTFYLDHREREGWVVHLLSDVTGLDLEVEELARGLHTDPQTQALNRRAFLYALAREMSRAERSRQTFQLLRLDLGDTPWPPGRGREAADQGIAAAADMVQSSVRQIDCLGRYDLDLLTLILPDTDAEGARHTAARLRALLTGATLQIDGHPLRLVVSLGWAEYRPGDTPQQLLQRAAAPPAGGPEAAQQMATSSRANVRSSPASG